MFILNILTRRETLLLEIIVQSRGKSLGDYMAQFNVEALKIPHLEDSQAPKTIIKYKYNRQDDA